MRRLTARHPYLPPCPVSSYGIASSPVNGQESFNPQTGAATISGTVTCNTKGSLGEVSGTLQQKVGRAFITGSFSVTPDPCIPPRVSWGAAVIGNGVFAGEGGRGSLHQYLRRVQLRRGYGEHDDTAAGEWSAKSTGPEHTFSPRGMTQT